MIGVVAQLTCENGSHGEFEVVVNKLVAAVNANEPGGCETGRQGDGAFGAFRLRERSSSAIFCR